MVEQLAFMDLSQEKHRVAVRISSMLFRQESHCHWWSLLKTSADADGPTPPVTLIAVAKAPKAFLSIVDFKSLSRLAVKTASNSVDVNRQRRGSVLS